MSSPRGRSESYLAALVLASLVAGAARSSEPVGQVACDERMTPAARARATQDASSARDSLEEMLQADGQDTADRIDVLVTLVSVLIELGRFDEAGGRAEEAVDLARRSEDRRLEALALGARGDVRFFHGRFDAALEDFRGMAEGMAANGDRFGLAASHKNIGITLRDLGRWEDAATELRSAIEVFRDFDCPVDLASALENLGGVWEQLGDGPRAFAAYREALELARASGAETAIAHSVLRLGTFQMREGRSEQALELLREAAEISERWNWTERLIWIWSVTAFALDDTGRPDRAMELLGHAIEVSRGMDTRAYEAGLHLDAADLLADTDPATALAHASRAESLFASEGRPVGFSLGFARGRALRASGDLDAAIRELEGAATELEHQRSLIGGEYHRATFAGHHRRVWEELVSALFEQGGQLEQAFRVVERARARSLAESIAASRGNVESGSAADPLALRERELESKIAALQRESLQEHVPGRRRGEILAELDEAETRLLALASEMRECHPRYGLARYPIPAGVAEARRVLGPDTALLTYFTTRDEAFLFVVTERRFRARRLEVAPSVLEARVRTYLDLIASPGEADVVAAARRAAEASAVADRLSDELLGPALDAIEPTIRQLLVAPDGQLAFLPFEMLPVHGQPLLRSMTVSYVPSATTLATLRRDAEPDGPRDDIVLFARPAVDGAAVRDGSNLGLRSLFEDEGLDVGPIPYSAVEVRAIRRRAGGDHPTIYLGRQASEARAKSERVGRARVLHFATHGLLSLVHPARSALLLAPTDGEDGFLQVREIRRLHLDSELVVVASCRSARGRLLQGEGVLGLGQAFLQAGAEAVVASLWDVDDAWTARLMDRFYAHLAEGSPKAEALRQAKLDLMQQPGVQPRHWGAFILIGDGSQPVHLSRRRESGPRAELWVMVAIVLGTFALVFRRQLVERIVTRGRE